MAWKDLPYWLKGGIKTGIVGLIYSLFPFLGFLSDGKLIEMSMGFFMPGLFLISTFYLKFFNMHINPYIQLSIVFLTQVALFFLFGALIWGIAAKIHKYK